MGFLSAWFGKPTREAFAEQVLAAMRKADKAGRYELNAEDFSIVGTGQKNHVVNLGNFYIEYGVLSARDRKQYVRDLAQVMTSHAVTDAPQSYEELSSQLRPKVWSASTIEYLRIQNLMGDHDPSQQMPHYELGSHLVGTVVVDLPQTMRSILQKDLEVWGVSFYEALETAKANLAEMPTNFAQLGDELYIVLSQDAYETSRLFHLDWVRQLRVKGAHVALAPARGNLLITGSENFGLLEPWFELAEKSYREDPRPLSMCPLLLDGDTWVDWMPPENHSIYARMRLAKELELANSYTEQLKMLRKLQQKQSAEVDVVPVMAINDDQGNPQSTFSVWTKDVRAWLPQTRYLSFVDGDQQWTNRVPWQTVLEVVGYKMTKIDTMYPPRWEVDSFPTQDELLAMDAVIQEN